MAHAGDVGTEIAPEVVDDPELAARLDDLLHRTCRDFTAEDADRVAELARVHRRDPRRVPSGEARGLKPHVPTGANLTCALSPGAHRARGARRR
jgi:hypothetical protein